MQFSISHRRCGSGTGLIGSSPQAPRPDSSGIPRRRRLQSPGTITNVFGVVGWRRCGLARGGVGGAKSMQKRPSGPVVRGAAADSGPPLSLVRETARRTAVPDGASTQYVPSAAVVAVEVRAEKPWPAVALTVRPAAGALAGSRTLPWTQALSAMTI